MQAKVLIGLRVLGIEFCRLKEAWKVDGAVASRRVMYQCIYDAVNESL